MRGFRGHSSCRGGVCGASGCWSETEIKACCMAVTSCTAYYGVSRDWWTFHGECVLETHRHTYRTCMKPTNQPPSPPPRPPMLLSSEAMTVSYGGYEYRTMMENVPVAGTTDLLCHGSTCRALPAGYEIAPADSDVVINVLAAFTWSTHGEHAPV